MVKKILIGVVILVFLAGTGWLVKYFIDQQDNTGESFETEKPEVLDIFKKTVATGSIVPKKEVAIKPQVSGILDKLYVEPGQEVKKGQLLAKIRVIPNMQSLSQAQSQLRRAKINRDNAKKEFVRQEKLFNDGVIAQQDYLRFKLDYELAMEGVANAEENLAIIKEGSTRDAGASTTLVRSTTSGMVLDTPNKEGSQVIESNTFNEGTTIASIADMGEMIFEGKVDESEVGKLTKGLPLELKVGAIDDVVFNANLNYISPKGVEEEGAIKFDIKANVELQDSLFLRAGYSANADIVLDKKEKVLSIKESNIIFSGDTTFVEVMKEENEFEKKEIQTGISDGINIEVISGLSKEDKIKKL